MAGALFWLEDPIVLPHMKYAFTLSVPSAAVTLTRNLITVANRKLDLVHSNVNGPTKVIGFLFGNYNIDELVDVLNRRLLHSFKAAFSENIKNLHFTTPNLIQ